MPNWKKIIVSGSDATLSSLTVTNQVTASFFTGSFTGSFSGDGSGITNLNVSSVGFSNEITFSTDFTAQTNTYNSLHGPIEIGDGVTITVENGGFLKIEDF
jgi:hypothetical protein